MVPNQACARIELSLDAVLEKLDLAHARENPLGLQILRLMEEYSFDLEELKRCLNEQDLDPSFSRVRYDDVARIVGLDPLRQLEDIKTFELHLSCVPMQLLDSIADRLDMKLLLFDFEDIYFMPRSRSAFLDPIHNCLIPEFDSAFRNSIGSILDDQIPAKGAINYHFNLKVLGATAVLWIEARLVDATPEARLRIMAEVIAECKACSWRNRQLNLQMPIHVILCDATRFEFFKFDDSTNPATFLQGSYTKVGSTFEPSTSLSLLEPTEDQSVISFPEHVCRVCEAIFDVLLNAYASSLPVHRECERSAAGMDEEKWKEYSERWGKAIVFADAAVEKARDGEQMQINGDFEAVAAAVKETFKYLGLSVDAAVRDKKPRRNMSVWRARLQSVGP